MEPICAVGGIEMKMKMNKKICQCPGLPSIKLVTDGWLIPRQEIIILLYKWEIIFTF